MAQAGSLALAFCLVMAMISIPNLKYLAVMGFNDFMQ